jgi:hypothetical protein
MDLLYPNYIESYVLCYQKYLQVIAINRKNFDVDGSSIMPALYAKFGHF